MIVSTSLTKSICLLCYILVSLYYSYCNYIFGLILNLLFPDFEEFSQSYNVVCVLETKHSCLGS